MYLSFSNCNASRNSAGKILPLGGSFEIVVRKVAVNNSIAGISLTLARRSIGLVVLDAPGNSLGLSAERSYKSNTFRQS